MNGKGIKLRVWNRLSELKSIDAKCLIKIHPTTWIEKVSNPYLACNYYKTPILVVDLIIQGKR